jgi:hypothetical protein
MRYFLVDVEKLGAAIKYPEVRHKNYQNAGYNASLNNKITDTAQCIWAAEENINLVVDAEENNDGDKIEEITAIEAQTYIEQWQADKDALNI